MTCAAGCRIARVRLKGGGAHVTMLPQTGPEGDDGMTRTLIWALATARAGRLRSFGAVFRAEFPDGGMRWVEIGDIDRDGDGSDLCILLGGLDMLKQRLIDKYADALFAPLPAA